MRAAALTAITSLRAEASTVISARAGAALAAAMAAAGPSLRDGLLQPSEVKSSTSAAVSAPLRAVHAAPPFDAAPAAFMSTAAALATAVNFTTCDRIDMACSSRVALVESCRATSALQPDGSRQGD